MITRRSYSRIMAVAVVCVSLLAAMPMALAADFTGQTITAVSVTGNVNVPADQIMAAVKVKAGDKVDPEKIKLDMQAIYDQGQFLDLSVNFTPVPEGVRLAYNVQENPVLKEVAFKGNTVLDADKLQSLVPLTKGSVINTRDLSTHLRGVEKHYHDQGYILMKISDVATSPDGVLTISLNEGLLEDIVIKGHEKTKEFVISRELYQIEKGKPFNINKVKRSVQRVYNLGYFEDVNMKLVPGREPNAVVLELTVVEQKTGTFSIGAGYSKSDGMVGIFGLGDKNFRGTGDQVNVQLEFGGKSNDGNNYEVNYVRPWLDDKQTSLGLSLYDMTNRYDDYEYNSNDYMSTYDRNRKGWDITLGRPSGEYIQNYLTFKQRKDSYVEHVSGKDMTNETQWQDDNFGRTHSLSLARIYDTRDNVFNPSQGSRVSLTAEFAGRAFGGDFDFNKYTLENRNYWKVGRDHVIALRMTAGYADGKMPESGRFKVGGSDTLRGYEDDQFKGDKMLAASLEYRFPVANKVQGVVFSDIGNAWEDKGYKLSDLNASVGVGLRVQTPIGPIRLDYAQGDDGGRTHFSFGGQF
ncbi:MAG: BamA/TamA family outer membrane protein [Sporomusaceae bacterium]|nr:BamA/TamA family outer membrane protein [Sporomusaceae bacterium]